MFIGKKWVENGVSNASDVPKSGMDIELKLTPVFFGHINDQATIALFFACTLGIYDTRWSSRATNEYLEPFLAVRAVRFYLPDPLVVDKDRCLSLARLF